MSGNEKNVFLKLKNYISMFRVSSGEICSYESIAIIEFRGHIDSYDNSSGHYICDILEEKSRTWFRTNDNAMPISISVDDVSKQGYAILYKLTK